MADELVILQEKPSAQYLIAGWRRQWSDGGEISGGLTRYLIDKLGAKQIGELGPRVSAMCYPFQVPGTHDSFRPGAAYHEGLPVREMYRGNRFYDGGNGLIIFRGEEPWFHIEMYGEAFFQAVRELGVKQTVAVEGYNGAAPPDLERSVSCIYSQAPMKGVLERYALRFSSYGSEGRRGPTIGMAMVTLAHFQYPDVEMFRLGAMAPLYPFATANNEPVGIARDHRAFYDIMRRLNSIFKLNLDLAELRTLGDTEGHRLQETLEKIAAANPSAKQIIERARADYSFIPYVEPVELDPALDRTLENILKNMPDQPLDG